MFNVNVRRIATAVALTVVLTAGAASAAPARNSRWSDGLITPIERLMLLAKRVGKIVASSVMTIPHPAPQPNPEPQSQPETAPSPDAEQEPEPEQ